MKTILIFCWLYFCQILLPLGRPSPPEATERPSPRGLAAGGAGLSTSQSPLLPEKRDRYSQTVNGSLNQLWFSFDRSNHNLDTCGNSTASTCRRALTPRDACTYQTKTNPGARARRGPWARGWSRPPRSPPAAALPGRFGHSRSPRLIARPRDKF